jgi:acyl-CoA reductase-like NAD-dependent aldehyde dehydrogenase
MTKVTQAEPGLTINGADAPSGGRHEVVNPATGQAFASAPAATAELLDQAVRAAAAAFPAWQRDDQARRSALRAAAGALTSAAERIAVTLTLEQGKPLGEARGEVAGAAAWLGYYADLDIPSRVVQDDDRVHSWAVRRAIGPVAAIAPFNFPVFIGVAKVATALRAGNTVVWKPSPYTPLSTLIIGEVLRGVLPPGVLNVISGGDDLGAQMTAHPAIRKISFTGSIATGKKIAAAAAGDLKRLTLELGGNDAAIVLDDADPGFAADGLFAAAFSTAGQACVAPKRVYVHRSLYPALVDALVARAEAVVVGDGMDPATTMGPLNNAPQRDRVAGLVAAALAAGGQAATGGYAPDKPGFFYAPTIITGVGDDSAVVSEEQFGPALPVMPYDSVEEAVRRANDTMYGLGASVWGTDLDRAAEVAGRMEAGTTWVNTHRAVAPHQPFGGWKWSGVGIEGGTWGLDDVTEVRFIHRPAR